ncbi:hypothetical protein BGX38DRAFT_1147667 [Terfezia claveryi]|nr:hypothetical protein BGX38DRAFT_1147667 [Terfezia claveryi]
MPILNRRVPKSPRHLALRHAKKRFGTPDEHAHVFGGIVGKPEALAPGEERLYSYYKPSLVAGTYDVTTEQYISNGTHKALKLTAVQSFTVVTPQFALPAGAIHSQYPPEGHADVVETLPHVVLTDPHLPWERIATDKKQPDEGFNTIPWLALMVFTPEELQLPEDHPLLRNQTETKTVTLSLARLLEQSVSRVIPSSFLESNPDTEADFIFIEPGMFNELTTEYDPEILKEGAQDKCSVSRYKWLAHVRNINTLGMADSGEFEDEEGVFGVVVAHRAGPMDNEVAKPLIAHLVSIEYVAGTPWPLALDKRVALTSLYSWTYMSLPADSFSGAGDANRTHGPDLLHCVACGQNSSAGRSGVHGCLGRLRTAIHREGLKLAQKEALKAENHPVVDLKDALGSLSRGIRTLNEISSGTSTRNVPGHAVRWVRDAAEPLDISFASPAVSTRFKAAANTVMAELSSSKDGNVYNEINAHNFPDWPIVMSWVLDRMYLGNLPSQYIVPDPTHLPRESLRFFHIDPNWVEALIDGGLAVANQVEKDDDKIRVCIKNAITKYLQTPMGKGSGAYLPQVPTHGFLMRSELVTKYPDLILEAPFTDTSEEEMELKPASILRQENLDSTVLLALFDRVPGSPDFKTLIFRQPPHQQSFAAAFQLTPSQMYLQFRRVYTGPTSDPPDEKKLNINSDPRLRQGGAAKADLGAHGHPAQQPDAVPGDPRQETPATGDLIDAFIAHAGPRHHTRRHRNHRPANPARRENVRPNLLPPLPLSPRTTGEPAPPPPPRLVGPSPRRNTTSSPSPLPAPPLRRRRGERVSSTPAGYPKISYSCYGFGTYARASITVPMWPNPPDLRQDLIFSIQIDPDSIYDFNLYELQIEIRLGPMGGQRKTLARNYDGPGARMLSNLRFNVIPVTSEDGNLLIRLLPRIVTEKYGSRGDQVISDKTSDHPFVIVMRKPEGSEYDIDAVDARTGY